MVYEYVRKRGEKSELEEYATFNAPRLAAGKFTEPKQTVKEIFKLMGFSRLVLYTCGKDKFYII